MRTVEIPGGIPVFINVNESKLYDYIVERVCENDLNEYDAHLAQGLVNKGIFKRVINDGKTYFERNRGSL